MSQTMHFSLTNPKKIERKVFYVPLLFYQNCFIRAQDISLDLKSAVSRGKNPSCIIVKIQQNYGENTCTT